MKKFLSILMTILVLSSSIIITSCSKNDEDTAGLFPSAPSNVKAIPSDEVPNTVIVSWSDVETDDYGATLLAYNVFRATNVNGEFTMIKSEFKPNTFEDKGLAFGTTYYYKVQVIAVYPDNEEGNISEPVEVTTPDASNNPVVSAVPLIDGEAESAILNSVRVDWEIETSEGIQSFKVYKEGSEIKTVQAESSKNDYSYNDANVAFDQEYTYSVAAIGADGTEYPGNEVKITPTRPEAIYREVPAIVSVTSSRTDKLITVTFSDVSKFAYNNYEIRAKFDGVTDWTTWSYQADKFPEDTDGNKVFNIDCSNVDLNTGSTIWINIQIRIFVDEGWSDWCDNYRTFVF